MDFAVSAPVIAAVMISFDILLSHAAAGDLSNPVLG
jgi:hypothetical protein